MNTPAARAGQHSHGDRAGGFGACGSRHNVVPKAISRKTDTVPNTAGTNRTVVSVRVASERSPRAQAKGTAA